MLSEGKTRF